MFDDPEFWKECWDFIKSVCSELSASGVIRTVPGIGKFASPVFPWLRERIPAARKAVAKLLVSEARNWRAVARTPFGAFSIILMIGTVIFGLWGEVGGASFALEVGQGISGLGWMIFLGLSLWLGRKAMAGKIKEKLNL